ncbi:MAG: hypothetical protein ACLPN5_12185 [Roseiarcus sp.]
MTGTTGAGGATACGEAGAPADGAAELGGGATVAAGGVRAAVVGAEDDGELGAAGGFAGSSPADGRSGLGRLGDGGAEFAVAGTYSTLGATGTVDAGAAASAV